MTLKELLDSLSFDEIAPFIIKHYEHNGTSGVLAPYKQHFDYLRNLTPTNPDFIENKEAQISVCKGELDAYPLEGDYWEDSLSKELVLDKDVKASNAEIAACCLWHTSFWGYLPYQRDETIKKIVTDDIRMIRTAKFYKRKFAEIIPSKREMMLIPSFRNKIRSDMKSTRNYHRNKKIQKDKKLKSQWKRCWRRSKRCLINYEYNKRIKYCSPFIEYVTEKRGIAVSKSMLQKYGVLYRANHVSITRLDSYAFDTAKRFDYIKELIEKYGAMDDVPRYANCLICVSFSSKHPFSEMMELNDLLTDLLFKSFCPIVDDTLGKEIRIDVAYYE